ncbi:hypothetical protein QBC44DRAFT_358521 [Cladorrhinum sp. PSN332]|nr:hypothetical protein QBC44DRAFT_358521 [Cladorrhinum sp. PSN332]
MIRCSQGHRLAYSRQPGEEEGEPAGAAGPLSPIPFVDLSQQPWKGWGLSARIWHPSLAFQCTWNDCGAKLSGDSHITVKSDRDPAELMGKHARIKLSIAPAGTMRSDGELTIQAKQILKSVTRCPNPLSSPGGSVETGVCGCLQEVVCIMEILMAWFSDAITQKIIKRGSVASHVRFDIHNFVFHLFGSRPHGRRFSQLELECHSGLRLIFAY